MHQEYSFGPYSQDIVCFPTKRIWEKASVAVIKHPCRRHRRRSWQRRPEFILFWFSHPRLPMPGPRIFQKRNRGQWRGKNGKNKRTHFVNLVSLFVYRASVFRRWLLGRVFAFPRQIVMMSRSGRKEEEEEEEEEEENRERHGIVNLNCSLDRDQT